MGQLLVLHAGGREWRAAQIDPAELPELLPDLALIADLRIPVMDRAFALVRIAGALFLPHQPDLTAGVALATFTGHAVPIIEEVRRQACAARALLHVKAEGRA